MRRSLAFVLVLSVSACTQGPRAAPSRVAPAPASAVAVAPSKQVATVALGSCVIVQKDFAPRDEVTLVTPAGVSFAKLRDADEARLRGTTLVTTVFGLRLRTLARPAELPLYPAKAFAVGAVRPAPDTPLSWRAARDPSTLVVSPFEDERVEWLGLPPEDAVSCASLRLQPNGVFGDDPQVGHVIDATTPVAIAEDPMGPPIARVHTGGLANVEVVGRSGDELEVAIPLNDGAFKGARIVGWLHGSLVREGEADMNGGIGDWGRGMSGSSDWFGCGKARALFVDVGHGHERIGDVLPGTRVSIVGSAGGLVVVDVLGPAVREDPPPITLEEGATFLMSAGDARDCSR